MRAELRSRSRQFAKAFGDPQWIDQAWFDDAWDDPERMDLVLGENEHVEAWREIANRLGLRHFFTRDGGWLNPAIIFEPPSMDEAVDPETARIIRDAIFDESLWRR